MKIECNGNDLSEAVAKVIKAVPARSTNPVLEGIKLSAADGTLTLTATDLELSIEHMIRANVIESGDTVVPGQVLIRGTERMPHARGAVTARTWTVGRGEAELRTQTLTRTGRSAVETLLCAGPWQFPGGEQSVYPCEETEEETALLLDGLFYPVRIVRRTHYEARSSTQTRNLAAAKDESGARALTNALLGLKSGACVVDKRVEYSMIEDGKLRAVVTLESVMQIGQEAETAAPPAAQQSGPD